MINFNRWSNNYFSRQKFTFDVKWYTLLSDITIAEEDGNFHNYNFYFKLIKTSIFFKDSILPKEKECTSDIMSLKSRLSSIRDALRKDEASEVSILSLNYDKYEI